MDILEFETKWEKFREPQAPGLELDDERIIKALDGLFTDLSKIEDFKYVQIKEKFGGMRFYTFGLSVELERAVELYLEEVIKSERK